MLRNCYHAGGILLLAAATLVPVQAQQQAFHKKFEVGIRAGYLPFDLMRTSESTIDYTSFTPPVAMLQRSTGQSRPATVGASLVFHFNDKWGLGVDAMYRNAGYDQFIHSETIVDEDDEDDEDPVLLGYTNDRTRATFWDVPVLLRYTRSQQKRWRPKMTGMIGVSARFTTGIESYRETVDKDYFVVQTTEPVKPAHKLSPGATVGVGMEWKDEIGVRVSIEGRYTRWQNGAFKSGPTVMGRNTVEILLGLSF
ncbi:MAG TPA: outer membrane beta-barrel protein [Bryobacteraceae bacterium]|mgnify:CR=1 FL=1|nr:outer membrane beta-barrel protein [Bryobacteraceae bacterium]